MKRWLLATLLIIAAAPAAGPRAETAVTALRISEGKIKVDGRLDERVWRQAGTIADLTQQNPHPGAATPYRTEVRVLTDSDHLYFGITNIDPHPEAMAIHTLLRDEDQSNDDEVTIVLDTLGAGRLGYWFEVNAGGARADGLDVNDVTDNNWDGLWNAAVRHTPQGWTAEVVISTRSLQFRSDLAAWGLNIQRYVPREQLSLRWAGITLDSDIFDLRRVGKLYGVAGLEQGRRWELQPYALVRYEGTPGDQRSRDIGADIKYNFTPQLEGVLTVNPDFAEAEAEEGRVNLSRFPLFFPEKRPFFLEGSNQFTFGQDLNIGDDQTLSTEFIPYFSRRIGLVKGRIVPINAGGKLIGHTGPFSIGVLDVESARSDVAPKENLFVARATDDVTDNLRVGSLVTHGDPAGLTDNTFAGFDGVWSTSRFMGSRNLTVSGWYAHSSGNLVSGRADGFGGAMEYPNDKWYGLLKFNQFGDALDPAVGFLPRPGTRQYLGTLLFQPRPQGGSFNWIRQFTFGGEYIQVDGLDHHPQSKALTVLPLLFTTDSGYYFKTFLLPRFESLNQPFEVAPGAVIPPGKYQFNQYGVGANTPKSRSWILSASTTDGAFYSGHIRSGKAEIDWTAPNGKLQFGISDENDFGRLPEGKFIIRLIQLNAVYSFTPDLSVTTFVQSDTSVGGLGINTRLEWIIRPGRDLFIVVNHGLQPQIGTIGHTATGNEAIFKLRWDIN